MKLGKKDKSSSAAAPASKKGGTSLFLLIALLGALLGAVAATLYLQKSLVEPANAKHQETLNATRASHAAALVAYGVKQVEGELRGLAGLTKVREALSDPTEKARLETELARMLPHAERVVLSPVGQARADSGAAVPLSFAGLDLIRRVEAGQPQSAEAFLSNNRWFVQMAWPVKNQAGEVEGTLLAIFNQKLLGDMLAALPADVPLALVQSVDRQARSIAVRGGEPGADAVVTSLPVANWSLRSGLDQAGDLAPAHQLWIGSAIFLVLAVAGALVGFSLLLGALRQDIVKVAGFIKGGLRAERLKEPALKLDLLSSLVAVVSQHQPISRRSAESAADKVEQPATVAAVAEPSEPLFQDNVLELAMLESDEDLLGLGDDDLLAEPAASQPLQADPNAPVAAEIFRAYDIRGIVGQTLTEETVYLVGRALGSEAAERGLTSLCVGYDGRDSSPVLAEALTRGVLEAGIDVIGVGMVPTPVLYFATHHLETGSGVMVTGSHNPSEYNGLKMMLDGDTLAQDEIQALYHRICQQRFVDGQGQRSQTDVRTAYLETIINDIVVAKPLKVVVDAGNGVAGELGPLLLSELGCEVIPLYCEVDGRFPNHHPDPSKPENLRALIERVRAEGADIGIAFDGDGDRVGVVTNAGKIIWPDRLLMLLAKDVVSRNPGADVIFDIKCSRRLSSLISDYGGRPIMWKSGHSLMKAKMKETGALLAGEMSGHVFFKERWFGFDDGLYSAARLLEILALDERDTDQVFAAFPEDISTPEINIPVTEASKFELVERLIAQGDFSGGNLLTIDGLRVDYPHGWGLCRASNTTPVLVLRFEAESQEALQQIQEVFRAQLLAVDSTLTLPF